MPGSVRPGGRTARTRERVLEAVSALLLEEGYDGLTIDAVAARSGVHRATVYRRWRDVGGLLADTVDAARELPWEPPDTGSLIGDLIEINRQVAAVLTERPSIAQALIAASFRSPAAATALRTFWEDRYARAAIVVTRAADTRAGVAADKRAASRAEPAGEGHSDAAPAARAAAAGAVAGMRAVVASGARAAAAGVAAGARAGAAVTETDRHAGAATDSGAAAAAGGGADAGAGGAGAGGAGTGVAVGGVGVAVGGTGARVRVGGAGVGAGAGGAGVGADAGAGGAGVGADAGAAAEARSVIVAACAPLFYELALMRNPAPADLPERYARMAAAQFLSGDEVSTKDGSAGANRD
ncbi:hypothetical protein L3i22_053140 [Actinoplanes sp. L3-i22]|nr:hypothetical protein L3i22_053140 [Actinoplanes sp. L3-i22]